MNARTSKSACPFYKKVGISWLGLGLAVFLFSLPVLSQVNLGRILGTVRDETGGAMANARVIVTDQERGVSRNLTTDISGAFAAPGLTPGPYTVRVEADGFTTAARTGVIVQVGADTRLDLVMRPGEQTQTVTVTETVPLINTTAATLGGITEGSEVSDLPVIGRNYQQLLQFTPGVTSKPGGGSNGHSSNGVRSDGNNWLFEGIFSGGIRTAGSIINTNSSVGDGASVVPADAIQEMGVTFQNRAEYGFKPGVASNVGIKSGTNVIHGTAFAVGQTSELNARNPFNPAPNPIPLLSYQQYGATVGGPIKKDKLFFFGAFEGMQMTQGTPQDHATPTTALITGTGATTYSIPGAYLDMAAKGQIPAAAIDANGKVVNASLLNSQQQLSANLVDSGIFRTDISPDGNGSFHYGFTSRRDPNKNILGKIDYHISDKNNFTGEYFWSRDTELADSQDVLQPYWKTDFYLTTNVARVNWTYLPNSSWVNEFHWGLDRKIENEWPAECQAGRGPAAPTGGYVFNTVQDPCIGSSDPSHFAFPTLTIDGFDDMGSTAAQRRVEGYVTFVDNVSYTSGNHNMKFGFEMRRVWFEGGSYSNKTGTVEFGTNSNVHAFTGSTALEDFLMGVPSGGSLIFGNPVQTNRDWVFGSFIQDDWRVTPRVTVNLGLRWEYQSPLAEDNNGYAQFDPNSPTGLTQVGQPGLSSPWKQSFFSSNLSPRLGVVWDVTGAGNTVVRAGWGLYNNWPVWSVLTGIGGNPSGAIFYNESGATMQGSGTIDTGSVSFPTPTGTAPTPLLNWTVAGPVFPSGQIKCGNGLGQVDPTAKIDPVTNPGNPAPCSLSVVDQHWTVPYVHQWNLSVQHGFTSNISLNVAYVGSHGTNLIGAYDLNMPTVGTNDSIRIQTSRPYYDNFPWFSNITYVTNKDHSNYNALQSTLDFRAWHGLSSTVGYTWSHTLDVAGTDLDRQVYPDARCPECNYGPTPFDIRHKLSVRATYELPSVRTPGQILEGWQITSVVNLQGGIPWDVRDTSSNFSGTKYQERWNLFGDASDFNSYGRYDNVPCWGIAGSKFGKESRCTSVTIPSGATTPAQKVANMPSACVSAATNSPINPAITQSNNVKLHTTALASLADLGCYMSGDSVIVPLAQGTFSNMGKGMFRGVGYRLADVSVRKNTRITERLTAQLQFDMYNVTNTPQFEIPGGNGNSSRQSLTSPGTFGRSTATPNVGKGNVVGGSGDARRYQFGLKLTF